MNKDNNKRINFIKRLNFSFIALFLSIIVLLLIGETFCRIKFYLRFKDSYYLFAPFKELKKSIVEYKLNIDEFNVNDGTGNYYYKMKAGSYLPPKPYNYGYFTINSLGFRGKEFDPLNKNGKIRIFCIGESSTFGIESPDNQTWPSKLEYYLNQNNGNRFEIINSGFPGSASITYKNLIRNELINYKPDIFIIYAGANEMIMYRNMKEKKIGQFANYLHYKLYYKSSMLYTLLIEKISILINKTQLPINIYNSNPKKVFADNIREIIRICKDNNIKLILVRQMYYADIDLFLSDNLTMDEIRRIIKNNKGGWITEEKIYGFNEINKSLLQLCTEYGITVMDFRREFYNSLVNNDLLYYDYIHLTPKGNDMLARLISQKLSILE